MFVWSPSDIPGIDSNIIYHQLHVNPTCKPVAQKRRNFTPERVAIIEAEIDKLLAAGFILEVSYLDFLDAYSCYNQILMHEDDKARTSFIIERGTYCYKVMRFGLKNTGVTYQRLVNKIFKDQISKTMKVYMDNMLVKAPKRADHIKNRAEAFNLFRNHETRYRGTPASNQSHSRDEAAFHSKGSTKSDGQSNGPQPIPLEIYHKCKLFFKALKKGQFQNLKTYLTSPPLLSKPDPGEDLYVYLAVSNSAVSSALIREELGAQHLVFYTSKALLDA
ncbi:hypothetical protein L3X38_001495 [Prunus dulcis]|uniref:Transposable element protein n=1 Tax=Prunus dulcis TaxID=3755 RepID=A0AAD4ZKE1_PRUDU|nr:hypothetical protein L3X38_001495 [Prunus dulcis]